MSAASAPTICGTSACCARIMLTLTEPENTGPRITYGSPSIAFCTCAREVPGLLCVSDCGALILRLRMPPLALISSNREHRSVAEVGALHRARARALDHDRHVHGLLR